LELNSLSAGRGWRRRSLRAVEPASLRRPRPGGELAPALAAVAEVEHQLGELAPVVAAAAKVSASWRRWSPRQPRCRRTGAGGRRGSQGVGDVAAAEVGGRRRSPRRSRYSACQRHLRASEHEFIV